MLNPQEEYKICELKNMFKELKMPCPPDIFISFQVHKDGNLIFNDKQRGHSWTRNFYNYKCSQGTNATLSTSSFGAGYLSSKQTDGTIDGNIKYLNGLVAYGGSGEEIGIVLGTDDTAFDIEQYALCAIIAQGTGSGEMTYHESDYDSKDYTSKVWTSSCKRIFNNNSGGTITIKEVGLYSKYTSGGNIYMVERSVVSPSVEVLDAAQLTVTYEISMDFSSID